MGSELNLAQLQTFVAAAEQRSFIAAADHVHRSQGAVSMQILKLEESVGQKLFTRHTRRIELTTAGEKLLPYARKMLSLEAQAMAALETHQVTGKVSLGAPDDFLAAILPPVLEQFAALFPNVEIEIVCLQSKQLMQKIQAGAIDVALVSNDATAQGMFVRKEPVVWVGSAKHEIWKKDPLPVALLDKGCVTRERTLEALQDANRNYRTIYSSPSLMGILALVKAGLAVAALAECSVPEYLLKLDSSYDLPHVRPLDLVVVSNTTTPAPATRALLQEINRILKN